MIGVVGLHFEWYQAKRNIFFKKGTNIRKNDKQSKIIKYKKASVMTRYGKG